MSSGLALAICGVLPVNMADLTSFVTVAHLMSMQAVGVAFALAIVAFSMRMLADPNWSMFGLVSPFFVLFLVAEIGLQVYWGRGGDVEPYWGQRIGFIGYFSWAALAGLQALRVSRTG